jgi:hypothetical protein
MINDDAVFVISRDLLIKNKRAANRDKDLVDINCWKRPDQAKPNNSLTTSAQW